MDFITKLIAQLLETFKMKNPKTYALIALVLGALIYFANQGTLLGVFQVGPVLANVIQFISVLLMALTGSQTYAYLPKEVQDTARK